MILLVCYLATLALHAGFVGYVAIGTPYALVQAVRTADDPLAAQIRDRLPFMLGCGITAGVAPLLFLQLLYQRRFYTANLLLGPRWIAVIPALVVGFYALYVGKHGARFRRAALAIGAACFAFVAYAWSEQHALMQDDAAWRAMYAAGERIYVAAEVPVRFALFAGGMMALFAAIAAWRPPVAGARRRLATIALVGRTLSIGAALGLPRAGFDAPIVDALAVAVALDVVAWIAVVRMPDSVRAARAAVATGAIVLGLAVVVRELPRLPLVEPDGPLTAGAGGGVVFAVAAALGIAAIAWIVRTVRGAAPDEPPAAP